MSTNQTTTFQDVIEKVESLYENNLATLCFISYLSAFLLFLYSWSHKEPTICCTS